MADVERENVSGFVDRRRTQASTDDNIATSANFADVQALRARLTAINAGYFTAARLNNMTKNDMVYAVRLNDEAAGI